MPLACGVGHASLLERATGDGRLDGQEPGHLQVVETPAGDVADVAATPPLARATATAGVGVRVPLQEAMLAAAAEAPAALDAGSGLVAAGTAALNARAQRRRVAAAPPEADPRVPAELLHDEFLADLKHTREGGKWRGTQVTKTKKRASLPTSYY